MTGLNHALTGATVAVLINRPEIALPAALVSHFLVDMIPHWNYRIPGNLKKKYIAMGLDLAMSVAMLVALVIFLKGSILLIIGGGLLGIAPDLMWLPYFITGKPSKMHKKTPLHLMRRFHLHIQWSETDRGLYLELVWFIIVAALLFSLR